MPDVPDFVKNVIERFEKKRSERSFWESQWQDVKDLMRPNTSDFNRRGVRGERKYEQIFDATAVESLEEFASGLAGYLTSPTDRWFELRVVGGGLEDDVLVRRWLDQIAELIYSGYSSPASNFNPSMHEGYMDVGAFGTPIVYSYWYPTAKVPRFKTFPLADCWIDENHEGFVDTVFRRVEMTTRQIEQRFGYLPPQIAKEGKVDKTYEVLHATFPRDDRDPRRLDGRNKKFASLWIALSTKELIAESGFDAFPYLVPRWTKLAGETYGRGPGMKLLPDVKVLNRYEQIMLKAGAKAVDPPLTVPNDGFLLPIRTSPGAMNYREPGAEEIGTVVDPRFYQNLPFGLEMMEQKRENIRRGFYNDLFKRQFKTAEQTAFEINDEREEKLRALAPQFGRLEVELLGPCIALSYFYYNRAGMVPPMPATLRGRQLTVEYTSPAAKAQTGVRGQAMDRFIQRLVPYAQIRPEIMDVVNEDAYAQELARAMGTPATIIRSPSEIISLRQERAAQVQQQQMLEAAEPASRALLNVSKARETGFA